MSEFTREPGFEYFATYEQKGAAHPKRATDEIWYDSNWQRVRNTGRFENGSIYRRRIATPIGIIAEQNVAAEKSAAAVHDAVNHPSHYTSSPAKCECGKNIECIQVTEHMNFNVGNAVKYLWRAGKKDATATATDMRKAIWYITREIERLEREGK